MTARLVWWFRLVFLVLLLAGCSKQRVPAPVAQKDQPPSGLPKDRPLATAEDVYGRQADVILNSMSKLAADVAALKTTEEASAAVPALERQADELKYAVNKLKEMPALSREDAQQKKSQLAERVKNTTEAYQRQVRRIRGHSRLGKPLSDLQTRMTRIGFSLNNTVLEAPKETIIVDTAPFAPHAGAPPGFYPPPVAGPPANEPPTSIPADVVTIQVIGVPKGAFNRLSDVVRELNDYRSHSGQGTDNKATFRLQRLSDFDSLPQRITFGKVTSVDAATRTITVELDPSKIQ
jgi:hypothetical protein